MSKFTCDKHNFTKEAEAEYLFVCPYCDMQELRDALVIKQTHITNLNSYIKTLTDSLKEAKAFLENDLYRTRVKNALDAINVGLEATVLEVNNGA